MLLFREKYISCKMRIPSVIYKTTELADNSAGQNINVSGSLNVKVLTQELQSSPSPIESIGEAFSPLMERSSFHGSTSLSTMCPG